MRYLLFTFLLIPVACWSQLEIGQDIVCSDGERVKLSRDGTTMVVGSPEERESCSFTELPEGEVKVYRLVNNNWEQLGQTLVGNCSVLGLSVEINGTGDRIVVAGRRLGDPAIQGEAGVQIYDLVNNQWIQVGNTIFDVTGEEGFTGSIDITHSGHRIFMAFEDKVAVFELSGSTWNRIGDVSIGNGIFDVVESIDVSDSGDFLLIGSGFAESPTSIYMGKVLSFSWNGSEYISYGQPLYGTIPFGDFGEEVAISSDGTVIAVGGESSSISNNGYRNPGEVHSYSFDGSQWIQRGQVLYGTGELFGSGLAMNETGTLIAVGEYRGTGSDDEGCELYGQGNVRLYEYQNDSWVEYGNTLGADSEYANENDSFGWSCSMSADGTMLIVGAQRGSSCMDRNSLGYIKAYDVTTVPQIPPGPTCSANSPQALCDEITNTQVLLGECTTFCISASELLGAFSSNDPSNTEVTYNNECIGEQGELGGNFVILSGYTELNICPTNTDNFTLSIINDSGTGDVDCHITIGILPVTYTYFEAKKRSKHVSLNWGTANEEGNTGYEVFHSKNGTNWTSIGFVAAAGGLNQATEYSFEHRFPNSGQNHYRLLQTDYDGTSSYSEIRTVDFDGISDGLTIWPNPVSAGEMLTVSVPIAFQEGTLKLISPTGRVVREQPAMARTLYTQGLPTGVYYLQLSGGQDDLRAKVVVR